MPNFCANLTLLFNELPFMDRFAAAAKAGFKGVEYLFPYDYAKDELAAALRKNGLQQVLHNLPAGDWAKGERGIACHPTRWRRPRDRIRDRARLQPGELSCRALP
jgi:hydroxypyruvate isomerase